MSHERYFRGPSPVRRIRLNEPAPCRRPAHVSGAKYLVKARLTASTVGKIEEPVLWFRNFSVAVHRAQLNHLLTAMTLPAVSLGIIPMAPGRRAHRPRESFEIFDAAQVNIEMLTGLLTLTYREEVTAYLRAWDELDSIAVHHAQARALILRVMAALDEMPAEGDARQDE
jgi:hypothetical protein